MRKLLRSPWLLNILVLLASAALLLPFFQDAVSAIRLKRGDASSQQFPIYIRDDADLFTDEEEQKLQADMAPVAAYCPAALVTSRDAEGLSHDLYAKKNYFDLYGEGKGVLFLIDLEHRALRLQSNKVNVKLTEAYSQTITDNVYRYASAGNYVRCVKEAFAQTLAVLEDRPVHQPMKHLSNALIALCLGLMAAFWAAMRQDDVNRPGEVYQLRSRSRRAISITNGKRTSMSGADFAGTGLRVLSTVMEAAANVSVSDAGSGSSRGSGGSSGFGGSSGSRSSGGSSGSNYGTSTGGSHKF